MEYRNDHMAANECAIISFLKPINSVDVDRFNTAEEVARLPNDAIFVDYQFYKGKDPVYSVTAEIAPSKAVDVISYVTENLDRREQRFAYKVFGDALRHAGLPVRVHQTP